MTARWLLITVLTLGASGLGCSTSQPFATTELIFPAGDHELSAVLNLPTGHPGPYPVALFVHGDGAMPAEAYGYYRPLWEHLAKQGVASFAWSKPGVDGSTGHWLHQSMDDRADEVIAAIEWLQQCQEIASDAIGLIGYSQAGWVLPLVAAKSAHPDFMVLISGAVNWLDQGSYLTRTRLRAQGASSVEIERAVAAYREGVALLHADRTYDDYLAARGHASLEGDGPPLSPDRFRFAQLNWHYDARAALHEIRCPVLAVFGAQDQNVEAAESASVYREVWSAAGHDAYTITTFPDAEHGLLKAKHFRTTNPGVAYLLKLNLMGEKAFAPGYLAHVTEWVVGALDRPPSASSTSAAR
ncbi:MAG: alpha/beta hydrolase [Bacteroidota bacterium]